MPTANKMLSDFKSTPSRGSFCRVLDEELPKKKADFHLSSSTGGMGLGLRVFYFGLVLSQSLTA